MDGRLCFLEESMDGSLCFFEGKQGWKSLFFFGGKHGWESLLIFVDSMDGSRWFLNESKESIVWTAWMFFLSFWTKAWMEVDVFLGGIFQARKAWRKAWMEFDVF